MKMEYSVERQKEVSKFLTETSILFDLLIENRLGVALLHIKELIEFVPYRSEFEEEIEAIKKFMNDEDPFPDVEPDFITVGAIIERGKTRFSQIEYEAKVLHFIHETERKLWRLGYKTGFLDPIKEEVRKITIEILPFIGSMMKSCLVQIASKVDRR